MNNRDRRILHDLPPHLLKAYARHFLAMHLTSSNIDLLGFLFIKITFIHI